MLYDCFVKIIAAFSAVKRKPRLLQYLSLKRLNIIEGTYFMNPYFGDPYDLRIFMDIKYPQQIENVIDREGTAELDDYIDKWIPKTDIYIERMGIQEKCDITIMFS